MLIFLNMDFTKLVKFIYQLFSYNYHPVIHLTIKVSGTISVLVGNIYTELQMTLLSTWKIICLK